MKIQRRMPLLLIAVLASILLMDITATVSAHGIYQEYNTDGFSQPVVAVLMQGLARSGRPWKEGGSSQTQLVLGNTVTVPPLQPSEGQSGVPGQTAPSSPDSSAAGTPSDDNSVIHPTVDTPNADSSGSDTVSQGNPSAEKNQPGLPGSNNGQNSPDAAEAPQEPAQYEFTEVTQDYFDDALFIGDSRAVGIQLYSGWDNLTYCTESGMTIYNMFDRQITQADGTKTTLEEALTQGTFGKIYLEIGINEMGTGTVDSFMTAYENAVLRLQELQPDADIFLCAIMYVRKSKSDSDPIFNNPGIRERNERIAQLADNSSIFYLDINEVTSDESGNLNPDYTWDEVHLLGKYNVLWTEYLSKHGIVKDT